MNWVLFEIKQRASFSPMHPQDAAAKLQPPIPTPTPTPPPPSTHILPPFNIDNKISPSILLIILILAIIFFVSGLLHLLVRLLLRTPERDPDELEDVTALQGQLQQLFHLHDAGVDQSFIDTLPVFLYKAIIGLKDPFDCAVCLCEFEPEDKLRLLPRCSHAFHTECIDTWLLSHSTCPLCRAGLLLDFPSNRARSSVVFALESGGESSREFAEAAHERTNSVFGSSSRLRIQREAEFGSTQFELSSNSFEIRERKEDNVGEIQVEGDKIVQVRLGKFKNVDVGEGSSEGDVHSRRCYSMGSFAYVLDESSSIEVPIRTPTKQQSAKKRSFPINSGCRTAISEYGADSRRDFNGIEAFRSISTHHSSSGSKYAKPNGTVQTTKKESFSMSKIWMRREKQQKCYGDIDSSKRAFSSRFPVGNSGIDSVGDGGCSSGHGARRTISEGSEVCFYAETQSCYSLDSQVMPQSANTARTLLWLMGRQNKVAHSSCSSSFR